MKPDAASRAIAAAIGEATARRFDLTAVEPVGGGCIHAAMRFSGGTAEGPREFFVKASPPGRAGLLAAEAEGLEALRAAGAVRVPGVVARGADDERAWLALEWLALEPLGAASGAALGEALARQHRATRARFGWPRDNFIGASPQANGESDDWLDFWIQRRLLPQLRMAAGNRLPSRMIDRGERLAADCGAFFRGHAPAKSLLHGDLWGGNAAALADGTPVVFDPAVYAGDRECDIAMTELFGGFPRDFHDAYRAAWPLDEGYRARGPFYNLYHVLNHANLFAGHYVEQAGRQVERLLSEVA